MTSRELVVRTLEMREPARVPLNMGWLRWAEIHHPRELADLNRRFPSDIVGAPGELAEPAPGRGNPEEIGEYVDAWGCRFVNIQRGVIGEVKDPIIKAEDWSDADDVRMPVEWLTLKADPVQRFCAGTDRFVTGGCCPRPFEQLQFLRGSEALYVDLMERPPAMMRFLARMHDFYCRWMEVWARTDVDALNIMDDWGAQRALLIDPELWRELFQPLYRDYIDIAHRAGKKLFMHSDGYILDIFPDLVDMGVDAINSQIFCMGLDRLEPFAGRIAFWGEIDRQHLLPHADADQVEAAVRDVRARLWRGGGCIAQLEFGPGAKPENVERAMATWASFTADQLRS